MTQNADDDDHVPWRVGQRIVGHIVWHAEEEGNAFAHNGTNCKGGSRRSPASQDARLLETSHMTFTFPCHTLQASSSTRLFPVKAVPFLTDDNMPCVKCHMTRDDSHKGLPQVPARTPQLFRELVVEHANKRIRVILECGTVWKRRVVHPVRQETTGTISTRTLPERSTEPSSDECEGLCGIARHFPWCYRS